MSGAGLDPKRRRRMATTAAIVTGAVVAMVGMSFAAVPLYEAFCKVTGYGGTTQEARGASRAVLERTIDVRFDANVAPGMPLEFTPLERVQTLRLGETGIAKFRVRNLSDEPLAMAATYNVAPFSVGSYFVKLECFCFQNQVLNPHEEIDMPVVFYVDPELATNFETEDVRTVTLSYTYFRGLDDVAGVISNEGS